VKSEEARHRPVHLSNGDYFGDNYNEIGNLQVPTSCTGPLWVLSPSHRTPTQTGTLHPPRAMSRTPIGQRRAASGPILFVQGCMNFLS
jgi:hypothetical protein